MVKNKIKKKRIDYLNRKNVHKAIFYFFLVIFYMDIIWILGHIDFEPK